MISKAQCSLFSILAYYFLILNSFWGCMHPLVAGILIPSVVPPVPSYNNGDW